MSDVHPRGTGSAINSRLGASTEGMAPSDRAESAPVHVDFHRLMEALDVAVIVQDHQLHIIYANPKATSLLGISTNEITSRTTVDERWDVITQDGNVVEPDEHPGPLALRTKTAVSGVVLGVRRADAVERVWILVSAAPELNADGSVERVVISFSDVSSAQRTLRAHEAMYQSVFRSMSEGLVVHNMDGSIRAANTAAERVLGLSVEQMTGRRPVDPSWRLVRPDGSPVGADFIPSEITTRTGEPAHAVMGVHRPTGELAWVEVHADPLQEPGEPQMTGVLATFTDITAERNTSIALEASRAQLQRVLDAVPGIVYTFRYNGRGTGEITFAAGCIHEITGLDAEAVRARPSLLDTVFDRETQHESWRSVAEAAEQQKPFTQVFKLRTPTGETRWVRTVGVPTPSEDGVMYTAFTLDVTREQQMEDALRRSQRREALGDMAAGMAHNFNNMLAVILPNIQLAREASTADASQHLADAERAAISASDLVKRILALGHAEVRADLQVDLVPLLRDSVHMCRQTFDRGITILDDIALSEACVRGASSAMQQVILNLLLNARDAMMGTTRPVLTVRLAAEDDNNFLLTVTDSGSGMSAETLRRLGEPFYTTKGPASGTGLGLASAFHTISEAGGQWRVQSTLGGGTTFNIVLPRVAAPPTVPKPITPVPKRILSGTVLIIDDEPMVRAVLARQMTRAGMHAEPVEGAEEALSAIRQGRLPDLRVIFLDLSMPWMSGEEALPLLRRAAPGVPIIALSGHVPESLELPGAAAVLQKPVGQRELVAAVTRAMYAPS